MSSTIRVQLKKVIDNSYQVEVASGLLKKIEGYLPKAHNYVIITDSVVEKLYGKKLLDLLKKKKMNAHLISFPAGERSKNQKTKTMIDSKMLEKKCGRDTIVLALGGGVVGDMAGYVAATYMRGIPYIQIPTTLLAMVDSALGGKTGIDTKYGKNLIGAFWQPSSVVVDIETIIGLPDRQYYSGLFEALKMFATHDAEMFGYAEKNIEKIKKRDKVVLQKIVERAVKVKAGVVARDEREGGERAVMNFGHTIGHAIEQLSKYKMPHGYAVALGVAAEGKIAVELGKMKEKSYRRLVDLFTAFDLSIQDLKKFDTREIIKMTRLDKKAKKGRACYVILSDIGLVCKKNRKWVHEVEDKVVGKVLKEI